MSYTNKNTKSNPIKQNTMSKNAKKKKVIAKKAAAIGKKNHNKNFWLVAQRGLSKAPYWEIKFPGKRERDDDDEEENRYKWKYCKEERSNYGDGKGYRFWRHYKWGYKYFDVIPWAQTQFWTPERIEAKEQKEQDHRRARWEDYNRVYPDNDLTEKDYHLFIYEGESPKNEKWNDRWSRHYMEMSM